MKPTELKYNNQLDELHIIFKNTEVPIIYKLDNNVSLEFDDDTLCSIILPNFQQMMRRPIEDETTFSLSNLELVDEVMIVSININEEFNVNAKIDVSSLK